MPESTTIACADCGSVQRLPPLPPRGTASCHRCGRVLDRRVGLGLTITFACSAAMLILLPPAFFMPVMYSTIKHLVFGQSRLVSSIPVIYSQVWFPFAFGFLFFAFIFPALRAFLLMMVLGSVLRGWNVRHRGRLFRWSDQLRIWSMTDVVVIAGFVAYFRAAIPAEVDVEVGGWCYLIVAVLAIVAERSLDRRAVWNAILPDAVTTPGDRAASCVACEMTVSSRDAESCPRCGGKLRLGMGRRFVPAVVAIAAAIPLSLPAYSASVVVNGQLTGVWEQTVYGTVQLLDDRGFWQFGIILLLAGVAIPLMEMLGMTWLLARVQFPARDGLVRRTRFYRLLHHLVRWPMVIPFVAAIAAPIVNFRGIDQIVAGPGATPLFMVIALLILAVRLFEPRLMWQSAGEG